MYKLKQAVQRSSYFALAVGLLAGVGSSILPAFASADSLNPLTERSLTLSSSSPGFHYTDGSGNSLYSPAGSGNNGQRTGEVLTFKVSSTATVKAMTMQFCTKPAGYCLAPGDNYSKSLAASPGGNTSANHTDTTSSTDLNVAITAPGSEGVVPPNASQHSATNNFEIFTGGTQAAGTGTAQATGWTLTPSNVEDAAQYAPADTSGGHTIAAQATGKNNFITFKKATGMPLTAGQEVSISLYGTDANYITNPGSGAFFVKVNTYSDDTTLDNTTRIDGGVTVANVMNDSVQITTKVLETMTFSVGTTNPDTDTTITNHGTCDSITKNDPIQLGDTAAEFSLSTTRAYDGYSYWRLSSNSSNGATVYYSGYTLHNTENDRIQSMYRRSGAWSNGADNGITTPDASLVTQGNYIEGDGSKNISVRGTEQFGLAIEAPNSNDTDGSHTGVDTLDTGHGATSLGALAPLNANLAYDAAAGTINTTDTVGSPNTALFAFKDTSLYQPAPIAAEGSAVIHCSTAKMRYLANIAPDTPAGIYTSKINYIAAPQY